MKKTFFAICAIWAAIVSAATVSDVKARQRYPWNGLVDIDYTLNGDTSGMGVQITVTDRDSGTVYNPTKLSGDLSLDAGPHRVTWSTAEEGIDCVSTNMVASVALTRHNGNESVTNDLYMVIDISGGSTVTSYPVSYLSDVPAGGWTDEYKTKKIVMRKIYAGEFTMGSPPEELGHRDDEKQHQVTISSSYYIGVFEVTQRQYLLVMGNNPSYYVGDTRPVEKVSWGTITANDGFLAKIAAKTGATFSLPTEAQWEYACRAGTSTGLNDGMNLVCAEQDASMDEVGRYGYNNGYYGGTVDERDGYPANHTAVGCYKANAWGLFDMHGNVREWCADGYSEYPTKAVVDPVVSISKGRVIFRGGAWNSNAYECRSAYRNYESNTGAFPDVGFRLVSKEQQPAPDAVGNPIGVKGDVFVIDLSAGPNAEDYPHQVFNDVDIGYFNSDTYKTTKLVMRRIEPGTFTMGDQVHGGSKYKNITLTKPYYIGLFEVTQRQWELVMGTKPSYFSNASYRQSRPVETVSYSMIRGTTKGAKWPRLSTVDDDSFVGKIRMRTGVDGLDLPTEAQWEYAARSGTSTDYGNGTNYSSPGGDPNMDVVGRYDWGYTINSCNADVNTSEGTAKVGTYAPNKWGIYDMHGNVFEWCLDWHGELSAGVEDPVGSSSVATRVIRGGSWYHDAYMCTSHYRGEEFPSHKDSYNGFRLAGNLPDAAQTSELPAPEIVANEDSLPWLIDTRVGQETMHFRGGAIDLVWSSLWSGNDAATVTIRANGEVLESGKIGEGVYTWTPANNGVYTLVQEVYVDGALTGEPVSSTIIIDNPISVSNVTARQRYPWNGLVDIDFAIGGDARGYEVKLSVVDRETGMVYTPTKISGDASVGPGRHRVTWSTFEEGVSCISTNMVATVSLERTSGEGVVVKDLYAVVDLSRGPDATSYPVSYQSYAPRGGWSDEFKTTKLVMRKISPGTFMMGSPSEELGRRTDETRHQVTISNPYFIGVFEVTQKQYELVMGVNPSAHVGDMRPVECVSWNNVTSDEGFIAKVMSKAGIDCSLPTEAQWEYACRAGTTTAINSGKDLSNVNSDPAVAEVGCYVFNRDEDVGGYASAYKNVGTYLPNAWGLYDMHGNVYELCYDWYGTYPECAVVDPTGKDSGTFRVFRGGSIGNDAQSCRSATRDCCDPNENANYAGFRIVMMPASQVPGADGSEIGEKGDVLVIDLSGGTDAVSYPCEEFKNVDMGTFNADAYKTSKLVMRRIVPGTFAMGNLAHPSGNYYTNITVSKSFYIGLFEVTQKQWELVMGNRPSRFANDLYYETRPVEKVTYEMIRGASAGTGWPVSSAVDGNSFIGRIRAKTGIGELDLPTEAQWEYAARAGTDTDYGNGENYSNPDTDSAVPGRYWYNGGLSSSDDCSPIAGTAKVGSFAPNNWGLYDVNGNVWEWCLDWNGDLSSNVVDPVGADSGTARVHRGGGWYDHANRCTSYSRASDDPSNYRAYADRGLRLAMTMSSFGQALDQTNSDVYSSDSEAWSLDTRAGLMRLTVEGTMRMSWSGLWNGGDESEVSILANGSTLVGGLTGEGEFAWEPVVGGYYTLEHVTAGGETLSITVFVPGLSIADAEVVLGPALVYDGTEQTQTVDSVIVDGQEATFEVSGNTATEAGTYTLTISGTGIYSGSLTKTWMIAKGVITFGGGNVEPGDGEVPDGGQSKFDASFVYDGAGHTIDTNSLAIAFAEVMGEGWCVEYSVDADDGTMTWETSAPTFTNAGVYGFEYRVSSANYEPYVHQAKVTISRTTIVPPVIADLTFTGVQQVPAIPEDDRYEVTFNPGGIYENTYVAILTLTDPLNWQWESTPADYVMVYYKILPAPGGDTPGGDTPGGDTPGGDTPGGDTPGGDTPGGDTPGGDTPGGDTPGGDTPGTGDHPSANVALNVGAGVESEGEVVIGNDGRLVELPIPRRQGYVFAGWYRSPESAEGTEVRVGDMAPSGDLTLYPRWERRQLWYSDGVFGVAAAEVYLGYLLDANEVVAGTIEVTVGKPAKDGSCKVTANIQITGARKETLKGQTTDGSFAVAAKDGRLDIHLGTGGLSGTFAGYVIDGSRNGFKSKSAETKAAADRALSRWQGVCVVAIGTANGYAGISLEVGKKGVVKVSGALPDGAKVSGKTQLLVGERDCAIAFSYAKKSSSVAFLVWLCADGSVECSNLNDSSWEVRAASVKSGAAALAAGTRFRVDAAAMAAKAGVPMLVDLLPNGVAVGMSGGKFAVPKAGKVALLKDKSGIDQAKLGNNPSGLKLTYTPRNCSFKGSFAAYTIANGKFKKYKATVTGVVLKSKGYGMATIKGLGSFPVMLE